MLEDEPDPPRLGGEARGVRSAEEDRPALGQDQARHCPEQEGFPCSRRSHDKAVFAGIDMEPVDPEGERAGADKAPLTP